MEKSNVISFLDHLKRQTLEYRKQHIRNRLIEYYTTINQNKVSIPAFILAENDIKRIEKDKSINYWYKRLYEAR